MNLIVSLERWDIIPPASHPRADWQCVLLSWPLGSQSTTCQSRFLLPLVMGSLEEDAQRSIGGVPLTVFAVCKTALFWPPVNFSSSWHYLCRWSISPTTSPSSPCPRPILTIHFQVGSLCLQVIYDSLLCHPLPHTLPSCQTCADVELRSWWLFWLENSPAGFPFSFKADHPARPMCYRYLTHLEPVFWNHVALASAYSMGGVTQSLWLARVTPAPSTAQG